jgi:type II secretory pathway pseudopilin PulG
MKNKDGKTNGGVSVIEVLIVVAFIAISFVSLLGLVGYSLEVSNLSKKTLQANNLAQEAMEALRNFRDDKDWSTQGLGVLIGSEATNSGPWKVKVDTGSSPSRWALEGGAETIDSFSRQIFLEKVSRDANKNIEQVYFPGRDDPDTRKARTIVSWEGKEVELIYYLTNWK